MHVGLRKSVRGWMQKENYEWLGKTNRIHGNGAVDFIRSPGRMTRPGSQLGKAGTDQIRIQRPALFHLEHE